MFRGGAYKPRTSPYAFQGQGTTGIKWLTEVRERYGMPIVSEMMGVDKLDEFEENVDLIQVGARNMQNFDLLKALGKSKKPVLLKRGLSNTIEEWIMAAEYIVESMSLAAIAAGADGLILEVHNNPECAWSDGAQSLKPDKFKTLIEKGRAIAKVIGRGM